jgi:hypothetical protein
VEACDGSGATDDQAGDAGTDGGGSPASPWLLVDADMGLDDARVVLALPMQGTFHVAGVVTVEGLSPISTKRVIAAQSA